MATLVLLQKDLRLKDNPSLYNAVQNRKPVIVTYVSEKRIGSASKWWLTKSLQSFRSQLEQFQIPLLYLAKCDATSVTGFIDYLQTQISIDEIYSNGLDFELPECFHNIHKTFHANLIFDPDEMTKQFKVFTPFWKFIRANCTAIIPLENPNFSEDNQLDIKFNKYSNLPTISDCCWNKIEQLWTIGENAAQNRYKLFVKNKLANYDQGRDMFSEENTSKLSPHIRFGEISVRQIYQELNKRNQSEKFINELGWREFAYHLLRHHPDMNTIPLNVKYKQFWPNYNESDLEAWKNGLTGYPVIDAAMRELKETGWMHNRLRMLVGSFLVKNLLIPWQLGEQWFYDCLVDADLASNALNWQWVAGCGTDSVPYFRIFNPMLQGQKFDPKGTYVRKWIPELNTFPMDRDIHRDLFKDPSLRPNDYVQSIIDFKTSRTKALDTFKALVAPKVVQMKKEYYKSVLK